jgi:transcriptional regulator with XRE-family HTH domain
MRNVATKNPSRIELGELLKRARDRAGLSAREVESHMHWGEGKATRVEAGTRILAHAEVMQLAELYKLGESERATLNLLADAARRRESPARVADFAQTYVALERSAREIDYFDAELIPAIAQTERYARAVLGTVAEPSDDQVAARLARGSILHSDNPAEVRLILGEGALHRMVGGPDVTKEQLAHLLELQQLPTVSIRILEYRSGAHLALGVGFVTLTLDAPRITRVYIEGLTDATYIHDPAELEVYKSGFDQLWNMAADDQQSETILRRHIST